jgi:hypothetical protein
MHASSTCDYWAKAQTELPLSKLKGFANRKVVQSPLNGHILHHPSSANILTLPYRYVMLRDVNDSVTEARELVKLLKELPAHVNLM